MALRILVAAFAALVLASAPALAQPKAPLPWIDAHLHLVGGRNAADYSGAVDAAVREMDRFGIAVAIVMPTPQIDAQSPYDHPSYAGALGRYRGRFAFLAGGGLLNPVIHRYADAAKVTDAVKARFTADAERALDAGASGFGEIAALHVSAVAGHPFESVPADHPLLLALADVAAKRGVPIDLHMDAVDGEAPLPPRMAGGANPPKLTDTLAALPRLLAHNSRGDDRVGARGLRSDRRDVRGDDRPPDGRAPEPPRESPDPRRPGADAQQGLHLARTRV